VKTINKLCLISDEISLMLDETLRYYSPPRKKKRIFFG